MACLVFIKFPFHIRETHRPNFSLLTGFISLSHNAAMSNTTQTQDKPETSEQPTQQKPTVLEEDDEFEDFPVEGERLSCPLK